MENLYSEKGISDRYLNLPKLGQDQNFDRNMSEKKLHKKNVPDFILAFHHSNFKSRSKIFYV